MMMGGVNSGRVNTACLAVKDALIEPKLRQVQDEDEDAA